MHASQEWLCRYAGTSSLPFFSSFLLRPRAGRLLAVPTVGLPADLMYYCSPLRADSNKVSHARDMHPPFHLPLCRRMALCNSSSPWSALIYFSLRIGRHVILRLVPAVFDGQHIWSHWKLNVLAFGSRKCSVSTSAPPSRSRVSRNGQSQI